MNEKNNCCDKKEEKKKDRGFLAGILYGILPHSFCIAFIVFTIIGTTAATALLKPLLLNPYFFYFLIGLSLIFATTSAIIYLKRNGELSFQGTKNKWKYLSLLYGITIFVNLILFMVVFPTVTNLDLKASVGEAAINNQNNLSSITLEVAISCSGHAPLITGELKKINGVESVNFSLPDKFEVKYDLTKTSKEEIISLEIFKTYKAKVL